MGHDETFTRRALVVAGDVGLRNSLCFMLEAEAMAVTACPDGASVLAGLPGLRVDVCILDHHLPDMTGPELLMRLRARQFWAPALFIAGGTSSYLERVAATLDAPIVTKPLTGDALLHALSEVFAAARDADGGEDA